MEEAEEDDEVHRDLPICHELRAASQSPSATHHRVASIELVEFMEMVTGDTLRVDRAPRARARSDPGTMGKQLPEEVRVIMDEILSTEQAYGAQLEMMEVHFVRPLMKMGSRMTLNPRYRASDITPQQVASVIGNIESITQLNKDLLMAMRVALLDSGPKGVIALCQVFLDHMEQFDMYTVYVGNYMGKASKSLLALAGLQNFHDLLDSKRSYGQGGNSLDFNALLKGPIERIAAYIDLFTKLRRGFHTWSAESLAADSIRQLVDSVVNRLVDVLRTFNAGAQSSKEAIPLFNVTRCTKFFSKKATNLTLEIDVESKSLTVAGSRGKEQQVLAAQAILGVDPKSKKKCTIKWADKHGLAASAQFLFEWESERDRFITAYKMHLEAILRPGNMH
jgi:hypothetical protein